MNNKDSFDFCVLGAGLAGVSVAKSHLSEGTSVCLVDVDDVAAGASGAPIGLVNPCTGRYGTKTWKAEDCYESVLQNLQEVQNKSPVQFYRQTGVLRPALNPNIAARMQENLETTKWPEDWISWLPEKEVKELNPELNVTEGALWLPVGLTVDLPTYLKSSVQLLEQEGLKIRTGEKYQAKWEDAHWKLSFEKAGNLSAGNLIYTSGISTAKTDLWDFLKLHPVKGQLAILKSNRKLDFDYAISALGYIASLSPTDFVVGSTYEHQYDHREPDEDGLEYLLGRMKKVIPALIERSNVVRQWAGVRASTPNRKPILGRHPQYENVFVFAGLGSKGLLYSAHLSEQLQDYIFTSTPLDKAISVERFNT